MNRHDVLRVLNDEPEVVTFSVLSRALITNNTTQRRRSLAARAELRTILTDLDREGLVRLLPTHRGRGGHGLRIEVIGLDSTHEERNL